MTIQESTEPHHDNEIQCSQDEGRVHELTLNDAENNILEIDSDTDSVKCPYIAKGMIFRDFEEVKSTYLAYAKYKGFGVRIYSGTRSRKDPNLLINKSFVCDKEGKKEIKESEDTRGTKRRRETRVGCTARLRVNLIKSTGMWRVGTFDDTHNHEFVSPSKVGILRSHKQYHRSSVVKNLVSCLHKEGISNAEIAKVVNAGSINEDEIITNKECCDLLRKEREINTGHECMSVIMQFQEKMKKDSMFWFSVRQDKKTNILKGLFWADG